MHTMRAKFVVADVEQFETCERVRFQAVGRAGPYPADGSDEDNTFATFTPQADLSMTITNPALRGQYVVGQKYYADFSLAD